MREGLVLCEALTEGGVDMSPKRSKWLMFCELNHGMRERERKESGDTSRRGTSQSLKPEFISM